MEIDPAELREARQGVVSKCDMCKVAVIGEEELRNHKQLHTEVIDDGKFQCLECSHQTNSFELLLEHI